ncbi:PREDICTED: rRNA-processing protein EFG1-like [Nelumbo nucifera]|uniref:rRNA-processing protein EFG1 n=2 Tax=Nelumbo nucifera TaxID=4432 RepID=A0A1U8BMC0_NELNU|nr:PREDICTED: rRNA-processing protein EFG1-like [Nelumbo nucifera]DAD19729.1 TPA_asm: hypothetical protein HUJ06_021192 [Nelumbo nucifera]
MAHGGYGKRRVAERRSVGRRSKGLGVEKKSKTVSLKNQIRSVERMLRKNLPPEVREVQEKKLEDLRKQQELQTRLAIERKIFLHDRKIKFFERRKIERRIRRLEKLQRASSDQAREEELSRQLTKLQEDLEYVRFFPKTEKYVPLFAGGDDADIIDKRNRLRKQIKANIKAAEASGKELEETGSEDDGQYAEDDFFLTGSSTDEADADDEWTDKSTREQASSASGKAASGMSSDEKNQRQKSARALMPPPRPSTNSLRSGGHGQVGLECSSRKRSSRGKVYLSTNNTSHSRSGSSSRNWGSSNGQTGQSSNLSSNSDAHKPRRKRRPKKKKQQA